MAEIRQVQNGEWIKPKYEGYIMQCCKCGAQHRLQFRVTLPGPGLEMRGWRIWDGEDGLSKPVS